jgi:hypothetical protein
LVPNHLLSWWSTPTANTYSLARPSLRVKVLVGLSVLMSTSCTPEEVPDPHHVALGFELERAHVDAFAHFEAVQHAPAAGLRAGGGARCGGHRLLGHGGRCGGRQRDGQGHAGDLCCCHQLKVLR